MTDGQHISQDDLALLALQALPHEESAGLREHLADCLACRAELKRLSGDLAMIALSVDQHPVPAGARERFAQRIAGDMPVARRPVAVPIDRPSKFSSTGWIGWLAAAVLFIVAGSLGFEINFLRSRLRESDNRVALLRAGQTRAEKVAEVLTAPSAERVVLTTPKAPPAPTGRIVYLPSRGELILQANDLAPVPAGKTYELWVIPADGSAPVPAGLFEPDRAGNGTVVLPSIPEDVSAKAFGVTLEDAAGSKTPTAPILLAGAVSAQ